MSSRISFALALPALMGVLVFGCGDNTAPTPPLDSSTVDSSIDSRPPGDSALPDGGPGDGGGDAGDGGTDAGDGDGGGGDVGVGDGGCMLEMNFELGSDSRMNTRPVEVAAGADRFAVTWSSSPEVFEDIFVQVIPARGAPMPLVNLTDDTSISRSSNIESVGTQFLATWFDNEAGFEIKTRPLGPDGSPTSADQPISNNDLRDDEPALQRIEGGVMGVWVEDDVVAGTRVLRTRVLSDSGAPMAAARTVTGAGSSPARPVLSRLGLDVLAAWVDASGFPVVQRIDATGAAVGTPVQIGAMANAAGTVDIYSNVLGGAVVWDVIVGGVRPEVHFMGLDSEGAPTGDERILTLAPEQGRDPSIASLAGGFVVAYRAVMDDDITEPTLRGALVDVFGDVVGSFDAGPLTDGGGRLTARASADGTVLVAWSDVTVFGTQFKAARIVCTL